MVLVTTSIIRITLFVLIISTIAESEILDTSPTKDHTVRLVDPSDSKAGGLFEIRLENGTWGRVCNDSEYKLSRWTPNSLCSNAKQSLSQTTFEENSFLAYREFVSCIDDNCTSKENCPNGAARVICEFEKPGSGSRTFHASDFVYNGDTKRNCTFPLTLWMTYPHSVFEQGLPSDGVMWTSSFIKQIRIHKGSFCSVNTTNLTSELDCINFCLKAVANDEPLYLVSQKNSNCTCFTAEKCGRHPERGAKLYKIVDENAKQSGANSSKGQYCIAIGMNGTNKMFKAVDCDWLLPQLCGYTPCWPPKNGTCPNEVCKLHNNFTFSHCEARVAEHTPPPRNKGELDDKTKPGYIAIASVVGVLVISILAIAVCFVCLKRQPKGESQRQNSVFNRMYGDSVNRTSVEHLEDCETYDLIDEEKLDKGDTNKTDTIEKGVSVLGGYSSPNDAVANRGNDCDDYTTTYDDPIRKLSNHADALKLKTDPGHEKKRDAGGMAPSDIELKLIKCQPELSEGSDKGSEGKKNQFTGCLCSLNVSAESDLEPPFDQSQNIRVHKNGETAEGGRIKFCIPQTGSLKDDRSLETVQDQRHYHTLVPSTVTDPEFIREIRPNEDKSSESDTGSDYEDTVIVSNESNRLKKTGVSKKDCACHRKARDNEDDSDYEESGVFVRENMTSSNDDTDLCLHSSPEELLRKLNIRIVPSESTYETYSALPKSRADWMNPYYAFVRDQSKGGGVLRENDVSGTSNDNITDTDIASGQNSNKENEYDKIMNIKKFEQISNNTYDHISGLWKNQITRKRLNSC